MDLRHALTIYQKYPGHYCHTLIIIVFMIVSLIIKLYDFMYYRVVTDILFYMTDVLVKLFPSRSGTGHLELLLYIYVRTGEVRLGSSFDLGETKDAFLLRALDRRNSSSGYFICFGDVCDQIAMK